MRYVPQQLLRLLFLGASLIWTAGIAQAQDASEEQMSSDEQAAEVDAESEDVELQEAESLLFDRNADGVIEIVAFGDSITRGTGDFNAPNQSVFTVETPAGEAGYPLRIEQLLGLPVANLGIPGERITTQGVFFFAAEIPARRPDIVTISGGSNDAIDRISVQRFGRAIQTMINIASAVGSQAVLITPPPVCCDHSGFRSILDAYDQELRARAQVNAIPLADVDRAYRNTCNVNSCYLLNLPEGLHPNIAGYDVSGEMVTATLLGIDLLAPNGPATLEAALNLPPGSVETRPNAVPSAQ